MAPVAHFASRRADLIVIERPAVPIWEAGRQTGTQPGKSHQFREHRCTVEGQKSIDFMRARVRAQDGPEVWELDGASDVPPVLNLLSELATAEVPRVREILEAEQAGPDRQEVIATCQAILEKAGAAERGPGGKRAAPRHELVEH